MLKGLRALRNFWLRVKEQKPSALFKHGELRVLGALSSSYGPRVPSRVMLEITGRCNLSCQYCALSNVEYRKGRARDMKLEDVLRLLPQLKGVKVLMLYGLGEPLLYPDLELVIREARKHVPLVCFTTNGTLLTEARTRSLAEAGLSRLQVSLDGLDPDYHRKVRGGDVNKILANVEHFSRTTGLPVHLWAVVTAENIGRLAELVELKSRIPTLERLHFQMVEGDHLLAEHGIDGRVGSEAMAAFKDRVYRRCADLGMETDVDMLPAGPREGPSKGICPAPWTGMTFINHEGCVTPCCLIPELSLDSAVDLGFQEAWNGPQMRRLREEILRGNYLPSCSDSCGFHCNGRNPFHHLNQRYSEAASRPVAVSEAPQSS